MKKFWIFPLLIVFTLFNVGELIWVGEQFWTIIDSDGSFRDQRTITDFISFKAENDIDDRYIAYWITPHCDGENQFEAFGDAYFGENGKLCAKFIDKNNHPIEICGGFRILSINSQDHENPFEWRPICDVTNENIAVGLNQHIIRIWQNDRFQFSYGGVLLDRGRAYAVDVNGAVLHIFRSNDTNFYCSNIELLVVRDGYVAKEYVHNYDGARQHRHRNHGHIFTPDDSLSPPCAGPCNLTRKDSSITYIEPPYIVPPAQYIPPIQITETYDCEEWKIQIQRFREDLQYRDSDLFDCRNKLKFHETEIIKLKESQQTFNSDEILLRNLEKENEKLRFQISRQNEFERENEQLRQRISEFTIIENTVTRLESENQRLKESLKIYESQKMQINRERVEECERKIFEFERKMKFINEDLSKERLRNDDLTSKNERLRREVEEHSQKRTEIQQQWENAKYEFRNQKQPGLCNPGEINILKEKLFAEKRKNNERLQEIQKLTIKLVNVEDEKIAIEKQLLIIQSEQKSWNQTLIEIHRNCNSGNGGFLQKRIQELEIVLTSKDEFIGILKRQKREIENELVSLKSEYSNLEIVLVDLKETKKILEDERNSFKSQIEILEENCGPSKFDGSEITNSDDLEVEENGSKIQKSKLKSFAQKIIKDGSSLITKEQQCEILIQKLRRIYNFIQISSGLNLTFNLYENDNDKFIEIIDIFILQAWNVSKLEINALKLQQKIYISEMNSLKNDIEILRHSGNDNFSEDFDDIGTIENDSFNDESSDGNKIETDESTKESYNEKTATIFQRQLHSYEIEVLQYRREIFLLKLQLKNIVKIKYECKNKFQKFKSSHNTLLTSFNRFETTFFKSNYNQTRNELFRFKEVIQRQTLLIKNFSFSLREKKDTFYSSQEESWESSNSGGGGMEYFEEEEYSWEKSGSTGMSDIGFEKEIKESEKIEEIETSEEINECNENLQLITEKYHSLIRKLRSVYGFFKFSIDQNITTQIYENSDDEIFVEIIGNVILQAWNISKMEAETFKLEHQTCIAETDILKNDFGLHKHESEIKIKELTLENKNCTRQITHLNEKLIKFEGGEFSGNAEFEIVDGFEEWKLQYENSIKERNVCEEKLKIFETTQNSFMSFYYRLENYLLMSDCEKAITEITLFKQKTNNQTTTLNDINLHKNDVILKNSGVIMAKLENSAMAQYGGRNETYETLNKIKEEISILQKELCDYRQNNSLLLQHILERNNEMKKFKDSEALCKSSVISFNETIAQLLQTLEEKEIEIKGLKEKVDFLIPFGNQNQTLTTQIESLAQIKSDEDITNKCEGLQSYLKDILVMLKRNKEKCEEKFLDKIDENHIIEKREDKTLMSKKNVHSRQNKQISPRQRLI